MEKTKMNPEKARLKAAMIQDMARKAEKLEASSKDEVVRVEGAIGAFVQAMQKLEEHKTFYNVEIEEGKIDLEQQALIVKTIDRCIGVATSLRDTAQVTLLRCQGKYAGFAQVLDMMEKDYNDEVARVAAADAESSETGSEDAGRPKSAAEDLQNRREEAAAKKAKKRKSSKKG